MRSADCEFHWPGRTGNRGGLGAQLRDMRAVAVGALGEALVRAELEGLGWPMVRNVILGTPGRSVEIDQLARAPGGVIVLETKTYSGYVVGDLGSEFWILSLRDGRSFVSERGCSEDALQINGLRAASRSPSRLYAKCLDRGRLRWPQTVDGVV